MKKTIMYLIVFMMSLSMVLAATVTRNVPDSVSAGETFTITYTASGASGSYGVTVYDKVTGGCTPTEIALVWLSNAGGSKTYTMTAPSSGTCTFTGDWSIPPDEGNFASKTVTVGGVIVDDKCEFWEAEKDGTCGIASWVWIAAIVLVILVVMGGGKRRR